MRILTTSTPYKAIAIFVWLVWVSEFVVSVCVVRCIARELNEWYLSLWACKNKTHSIDGSRRPKAYLSFGVARKQVCWFRFVFVLFLPSFVLYLRSRSLCVSYYALFMLLYCYAFVVCWTNTLRATLVALWPFFHMECLNKHTHMNWVMTTTSTYE